MENLIKKMRLRNGMTQVQLARMVGVKQPTISRLETDAAHISWGLISKILIYFNIKDDEITTHLKISEGDNMEAFIKLIYKNAKLRTMINYDPIKTANDLIKIVNMIDSYDLTSFIVNK